MTRLTRFIPIIVLVLAACGSQHNEANPPGAKSAPSSTCVVPSPCWLTAGGAKFDPRIGDAAWHGPKVSFGGNVAPGCSLDPGEGGQWNHVDREKKIHIQGFAINEARCNGVETGSPDAIVNHIYFAGTGRLAGIMGNKRSVEEVCFTAEALDMAEPGSHGQRDAALIDRYFIRVTDCGDTELYSFGAASNDGQDDGNLIPLTDGNVQIHPCE
jgi:hypothetical protein